MASLSWLFGKKKSGTEGLNTTVCPKTFEESEGFQVVGPSHLYPVLDDATNVTSLPYDVISKPESTSSRPPLAASDSLPHNPIQDIPYKINYHIDVVDLETFLFEVSAVLRKAIHVNENVVKYNFAIERSVLNEEQCANIDYS